MRSITPVNYCILGPAGLRGLPLANRIRIVGFGVTFAFASVGAAGLTSTSAKDQNVSATIYSSARMADGKQWTTDNLNVATDDSYCYEDAEPNCRRHGRLYTWESARQACGSLGDGWRLPTNDEWQQLAKHHGGIREDSDDSGKAAYAALVIGGSSGFDALLGGGRVAENGHYARLDAHGFYWTASESHAATAWFYNFGKGGLSLNRHRDGNKQMALSVRCVRE
jgi:uncharacterized protein (TIGR02145 family)